MKRAKPEIDALAYSHLRADVDKAINESAREGVRLEEKEIKALFQALQVHQIELEMQNDELLTVNAELERQQLKFAGIYNLAPIGYFILNRTGLIEEVNNTGVDMLKTSRTTVIGKHLQSFVAVDDMDTYHRFFRQIINVSARQSCKLKVFSQAGHQFYAQVEGIAISTAANAQTQCYIAIIDITERITTENNLAETKERLEIALEAAAAGTWELDLGSMRFYLDELNYKLCNITEAGFDGKYQSFIDLIHPDDQRAVNENFRVAVNTEKSIDLTCRFQNAAGEICYATLRGHMVIEQNRAKRIVGIMMDITQKRIIEEEAINLKKDQQKNITTATLFAEENERKRISESLHDSVSQLLYGIKMQLDQLTSSKPSADTSQIYQLLDEAVRETRNISFELAPSILTDFGLPTTIEELAKRLSTSNLKIKTKFTGLDNRLDLFLETCIFRIIQELVNNCMKHAHATLLNIEIKKKNRIEIWVQDNGNGFDAKAQDAKPTGSGFSSIKNRLGLYNGILNIESKLSEGTIVKISISE